MSLLNIPSMQSPLYGVCGHDAGRSVAGCVSVFGSHHLDMDALQKSIHDGADINSAFDAECDAGWTALSLATFDNHPIQLSLAAYPRRRFLDAMRYASCLRPSEALIGSIGMDHIQLCPQNFGTLNEETVDALQREFPTTQFRLHANVRVFTDSIVSDFSSRAQHPDYWSTIACISRKLKAPGYSAHAGLRSESTIDDIITQAKAAQDEFECPVAIEGHYPTPKSTFLIDSWGEYRTLFESGANYAIDLSHLNIVAAQSRRVESGLLREMLNCERCIEVHISGNDGRRDQHKPMTEAPWWMPYLDSVHERAVIFTESIQPPHPVSAA
jgi:hypothetical protein